MTQLTQPATDFLFLADDSSLIYQQCRYNAVKPKSKGHTKYRCSGNSCLHCIKIYDDGNYEINGKHNKFSHKKWTDDVIQKENFRTKCAPLMALVIN